MRCSRINLTFIVFVSTLIYCCIYIWINWSLNTAHHETTHKTVPLLEAKREEDFFGPKNPRILYAKEMESYLLSALTDKVHWNNLNILNMTLPKPLPHIKSPCWWANHTQENTCPRFTHPRRVLKAPDTTNNGLILRCLPYFYLIGQAKSGTTDLFTKITEHPDIVRPISKEPFWFMPVRFQKECSSLDAYLDQYKTVARQIQDQYTDTSGSNLITGDGSTSTMSGNTWWSLLPGNRGCSEPCTTNADILYHLNPAARIIVSLRNPSHRCYSHYIMKSSIFQYNPSQQHFHSLVENEIAEFNRCRTLSSVRGCVSNTNQENYLTTAISLRSSIYYIHLLDWLRVFPRDQIHIVRFENYTRHVTQSLADIYKFLAVGNLTKEFLKSVARRDARNERKAALKQIGEMWPKTKQTLDAFFLPFNKELTVMLNDGQYMWTEQ